MATIHKIMQRWKAKNSYTFVSTSNPFPIMSHVANEDVSELLFEKKPFDGAWMRLYCLEGYDPDGKIRYRTGRKSRSRTVQPLKERYTLEGQDFQ